MVRVAAVETATKVGLTKAKAKLKAVTIDLAAKLIKTSRVVTLVSSGNWFVIRVSGSLPSLPAFGYADAEIRTAKVTIRNFIFVVFVSDMSVLLLCVMN